MAGGAQLVWSRSKGAPTVARRRITLRVRRRERCPTRSPPGTHPASLHHAIVTMTRAQLRIYEIQVGRMPDFLRAWRESVIPLRERFGFYVVGAWLDEQQSSFVWLVAYDGEGGFESAETRYYAAPERASIDIARYVVSSEVRMLQPLGLESASHDGGGQPES
jgi:NIPSNAP